MKNKKIFNAMGTIVVILMFTLACKTITGEIPELDPTETVPVVSQETQVQVDEARSNIEPTKPSLVQPAPDIHSQPAKGDQAVEANEKSPAETEREVIRQWGSTATASSEYDNPDWAASQAIGPPDTKECGDLPTAWASAERTGLDWLEIQYDTPVYPDQVNVIQTHMPNQVVKVELIDTKGKYHTKYTGQPAVMDCPYTLSVDIKDADYQVVGVKLTIDQTVLDPTSWNEIDAVELVGRQDDEEIESLAAAPTAEPDPVANEYALPEQLPSSIAAGTFDYEVAGAGEDATIEKGAFQDQSTTDEYVLGFVSENFRYAVTLFLPLGLNPGPLSLKPYDGSAFTKGPSAAIYIGSGYYYADGGLVNIESVNDDSVTGSFVFQATSEYDPARVVTVSGIFNEIPLVNQ